MSRHFFWAVAVFFLWAASVSGSETWRGIVVADEHRCVPYDRNDYPYPPDLEPAITQAQGGWPGSPYTLQVFTDYTQSDIEHIVSLSEAHDSGMCAQPDDVKRAFARWIGNLTLADPITNRADKAGHDAGGWYPDCNTCWFAARVWQVRKAWSLTIDPVEARVLDGLLANCPSYEIRTDVCR